MNEASRFLPLVKTIATQVHEEIAPHVEEQQIHTWAEAGMRDAFAAYRSRQGTTLRTYLTYRIRAAIYHALTPGSWPTSDAEKRFLFAKKSNELLLHFTISAEAAMKRSIRVEEEEMMHLLSLLVVVGFLIWKNVPRGEIQHHWDQAIASLNPAQRLFLQAYYDADGTLESASRLTGGQAFRFHLKILEKLAEGLKQV
jgi:hypothetical protein